MQESGLMKPSLICPLTIYGQDPVYFFPSWIPSRWLPWLMAWGPQHPLFADTAGDFLCLQSLVSPYHYCIIVPFVFFFIFSFIKLVLKLLPIFWKRYSLSNFIIISILPIFKTEIFVLYHLFPVHNPWIDCVSSFENYGLKIKKYPGTLPRF